MRLLGLRNQFGMESVRVCTHPSTETRFSTCVQRTYTQTIHAYGYDELTCANRQMRGDKRDVWRTIGRKAIILLCVRVRSLRPFIVYIFLYKAESLIFVTANVVNRALKAKKNKRRKFLYLIIVIAGVRHIR